MEDDGLARIFVRQDHRLPGGGSKDCHEARQGRRSIASRDFPRVEVIDRSMVIGAQGLLALVPMLIVMAAFLPADLKADQ